MKNSHIQTVKDPETFFPIVTKYFQEKGVIKHLQAKFLVEISKAVQNSNKRQLAPMKAKLVKKGVSSEFAIQFVLHYLKKKNLELTLKCGESELPNFFIIYQTTTTISSKLKLHRPPPDWLTEVLVDYKENNIPNTQRKENLNSNISNSHSDDFDSENSFDKILNSQNENEMNEDEYYSDDAVTLLPFKNHQAANKSKLNASKNPKLLLNDMDSNSNSS